LELEVVSQFFLMKPKTELELGELELDSDQNFWGQKHFF
jgi:hypothetical protein